MDANIDDNNYEDSAIGSEFSGIDRNGKRVMGVIPSKAIATTCLINDPDFLWSVPDRWSLEEAATVPLVYSTVYYSLIIRGKLKRGERVLIHSGTGGVGQAAINVCLAMDCQLFVSVGSEEKKRFLVKQYPKLNANHLCSSRDLSFKRQIMCLTDGKGVDVVLNSLTEDKLKASLECLSTNGRFLEIGKYDMSINNDLGESLMKINL